MSKSIQGSLAELAHNRHTDEYPTELEIMESMFREGRFGRAYTPFFLFERAMRLHAAAVWEEQKANPIRWGEKYGFPIIEEERDGEKVPRWRGAITRSVIKFHHIERFPDQTPDDYIRELKSAFAEWVGNLHKTEKEKYREEKKRWPKMDQLHHAEWFVLNHICSWSHSTIVDWEQTVNHREFSSSAVSSGIKNFADTLGVKLKDKPPGGRPKG